jgi:phytanoyl-CoA hydroxylase
MYIFKQPRIGGEVRWHQDASYLISDPPSVVGFWVALEDARKDNGCLWVEPGGHRRPLSEIYEVDPVSRRGTLRKLTEPDWPGQDEAVAVEVPAGSLVIFSDHMPHYSSPNRSERSRQAFTMHFAESSSAWPEKNWLQRPKLGAFRV